MFIMALLGTTNAQTQPQIRGLWVDAFGPGFRTPKEVDQLVGVAKQLGINSIFAQVGRRFDCYCNKSSVPRTEDPAVPLGFDPLEDLVNKAHKNNIQVHAWMTTTAVHSLKLKSPKNPNHVWNAHGEDKLGYDNWLIYRRNGTNVEESDYYLDLSNPNVSEYITQMYLSVAQNYAVDGIMLDRVRYPDDGQSVSGNFWGYSDVSLSRFWQETGFKGVPTPNNAVWLDWRRQQVSDLVRQVYLRLKSVRPELWVSAATIAYGAAPVSEADFRKTQTYKGVLQDWVSWSKEGWLDLNVIMNYKTSGQKSHDGWYTGWNRFVKTLSQQSKTRQAVGTALYLNPQKVSAIQIQQALLEVGGWVGYSYRSFSSQRNETWNSFKDLKVNFDTAGLGKPTSIRGVQGKIPKGSHRKVELWTEGQVLAKTRSDASGFFGFLNLPEGKLEIHVEGVSAPIAFESRPGEVIDLLNITLL